MSSNTGGVWLVVGAAVLGSGLAVGLSGLVGPSGLGAAAGPGAVFFAGGPALKGGSAAAAAACALRRDASRALEAASLKASRSDLLRSCCAG